LAIQHSDNPMSEAQFNVLKRRIDDFYPLLQLDGEWMVRDADIKQGIIGTLRKEGAVERVDRVLKDNAKTLVGVYRWKPQAKKALKEYWEQRTNLPCGHRVKINHHPTKECLTCKECIDEGREPPEYSKEQVSELL